MGSWRKFVKNFLLRRNIILSRPPGQFTIDEIKLRQVRERGLEVRMAVDGGAAKGVWARLMKEVYPEAQILCIEPRDDAQAAHWLRQAPLPVRSSQAGDLRSAGNAC